MADTSDWHSLTERKKGIKTFNSILESFFAQHKNYVIDWKEATGIVEIIDVESDTAGERLSYFLDGVKDYIIGDDYVICGLPKKRGCAVYVEYVINGRINVSLYAPTHIDLEDTFSRLWIDESKLRIMKKVVENGIQKKFTCQELYKILTHVESSPSKIEILAMVDITDPENFSELVPLFNSLEALMIQPWFKKEEKTLKRKIETKDRRRSKKEKKEPPQCVICMTKGQTTALIPCGHKSFCGGCATDLLVHKKRCPVCRVEITGKLFVYE